jgi:hypothetical protein
MHLIQIELPRASRMRQLDPSADGFHERARDFSLSDWWYFIFKYIDKIDPTQLDDFAINTNMPDIIKSAFERLCKQTWGADLIEKYEAEAISDVRQTYSTALAVEREEGRREGEMKGRQEGEMKGFIGEFVAAGKLSRKSLKGIKQNSPSEDGIWAIWAARETEMAEFESSNEEGDEIPEGRTCNAFITYLKEQGVIAAGSEEED